MRATRDFRFIVERTGVVLTQDARAIEAVNAEGRTVGMVAYDGWTPNAVQAHIATEYPAVWKRLLRPAFRYPFLEAGKGVLVAVIPAHNAQSLKFTASIGFRELGRIRDGYAVGDDQVVFEMRREECLWLEVKHGR